jgi:hypothetical protein
MPVLIIFFINFGNKFTEVIILNLTYLGYGLLIGPTILVIGGVIWCCFAINNDI